MAPLMTVCRTPLGVRRCFRLLLDDLAFEQDLDLIADDELVLVQLRRCLAVQKGPALRRPARRMGMATTTSWA
jgi:hypothetical protein